MYTVTTVNKMSGTGKTRTFYTEDEFHRFIGYMIFKHNEIGFRVEFKDMSEDRKQVIYEIKEV